MDGAGPYFVFGGSPSEGLTAAQSCIQAKLCETNWKLIPHVHFLVGGPCQAIGLDNGLSRAARLAEIKARLGNSDCICKNL